MSDEFEDDRAHARRFLEDLVVSEVSKELHPLVEKYRGMCIDRKQVEAWVRTKRQSRAATHDGNPEIELADLNVEDATKRVLETLASMIESACGSLGLELRGGVVTGMIQKSGFEASQRPVAFTEAGLVVVNEHFTAFCHVLTKALVRSLIVTDEGERLAMSTNADAMLQRVQADEHLLAYWKAFFAFFVTLDTTLSRVEPMPHETRGVHVDLLLAIELFVLAHEYAHHIRAHGRVGEAGSHTTNQLDALNEFEADGLAMLICRYLGAYSKPQNFLCVAGVGAVVVLSAMEGIYTGRSIVRDGKEERQLSESHPPLEYRLDFLSKMDNLVHPGNIEAVHHIFNTFRTFMRGLFELVKPELWRLREAGYTIRTET